MAKLGINLGPIPLAEAAGAAPVAGAEMAATLSPIEIMHRMGEQWLRGASAAERGETLRILLQHGRASKSLLQMLEGNMAERIVDMPQNKIPKAILRAAGSSKKQAQLTQTLQFLRKTKKGASPGDLRKVFGITMQAAKQAGLPPRFLDALRRMGPERVFKAGPTSVARVYDIATRESGARRLWRWATKGDPTLSGKKWLGTGPIQNLVADTRAQINELEGMAKATVEEEVAAAKGVFGKTKAAVRGGAARVGEAVSPRGLTTAEEGILGQLKGAGKVSLRDRFNVFGAGTLADDPAKWEAAAARMIQAGKTKSIGKSVAGAKTAISQMPPGTFSSASKQALARTEQLLSRGTSAVVKGLGKGASLARGMGGGAALMIPFLGYEAYDSLVGKSKRARAAMEASRTGGTASPSMELMYDILDKRADLSARRAMLGRDPKLTQQIVQALSGPQASMLTSSEVGTGIDRGPRGPSPGEMDELLNQLLGEMRGM